MSATVYHVLNHKRIPCPDCALLSVFCPLSSVLCPLSSVLCPLTSSLWLLTWSPPRSVCTIEAPA